MTEPPDSAATAAAVATEPPSGSPTARVIGRMIARLGRQDLSRGDLAALRRMDPDRPHVPAFIVLMLDAGAPEAWTTRVEDAQCWALIAHAMALMVPAHHRKEARVGKALQLADISEPRVARLLAARGAQFRAQIPRLARRLASSHQPVNWQELGHMILAEGRDDIDRLETSRLRVARDYYSARHRAQPAPAKDEP